VLLVNLLAALNFANVFLKLKKINKKRLEKTVCLRLLPDSVATKKRDQNFKKRKKRFLHLW